MTTPSSFCVLGPTASGKTTWAVDLAIKHDGEIISVDSRQVYQELTLGAGKDLEAYTVDGYSVPHHLIGIVTLSDTYHLYRFQQDCWACIDDIQRRGKTPILCGGTGLYMDAILRGYELPSYRTHQVYESRQLEAHVVGIAYPPDTLRARIRQRLEARLQQGMVAEVEGLLQGGVLPTRLLAFGLEYKWITLYLLGEIGYTDMVEVLYKAICAFAKRQRTWYRRMEKHGVAIDWKTPRRDV